MLLGGGGKLRTLSARVVALESGALGLALAGGLVLGLVLRRAQRQRPLENLTLGLVGLDGQRQQPLDAAVGPDALNEGCQLGGGCPGSLGCLATGVVSALPLAAPATDVAAAGLTPFGRGCCCGPIYL